MRETSPRRALGALARSPDVSRASKARRTMRVVRLASLRASSRPRVAVAPQTRADALVRFPRLPLPRFRLGGGPLLPRFPPACDVDIARAPRAGCTLGDARRATLSCSEKPARDGKGAERARDASEEGRGDWSARKARRPARCRQKQSHESQQTTSRLPRLCHGCFHALPVEGEVGEGREPRRRRGLDIGEVHGRGRPRARPRRRRHERMRARGDRARPVVPPRARPPPRRRIASSPP